MIISRTPYRISFTGGMSDLKSYYEKYGTGNVISSSIDKYIYVILNEWKDNHFRLIYSKIEEPNIVEEIQHPLIRECLRYLDIKKPLELMFSGDIRAGSGLGSSGSFTVGLLNALHTYRGDVITRKELAEEAYHIEVELLGCHGGKQDQYAASYGGLNHIQFSKDSVNINPINLSNKILSQLSNNLLLFNTNISRSSNLVLSEINKGMNKTHKHITKLSQISDELRNLLNSKNPNLEDFGKLIYKDWKYKKISSNISNSKIDSYIKNAINAGAIGAKLCGAGRGGYIMVYCKEERCNDVRKSLSDLVELDFKLENTGSKIIYK